MRSGAILLVAVLSVGSVAAAAAQDTSKVNGAPAPAMVPVKETPPGLLAEAKIKPADAQNIAQTKYPDGTILTAEITRRGKDLVYVYMIQPKGEHRPREILVSAMDGTILKTKAIGEKQDTTEKKDTTRIHKGQVTGDE